MKQKSIKQKKKIKTFCVCGLLCIGYRLHMVTSVVRNRNEGKHEITALNFRVGRMWTTSLNLLFEAMDFYSSLEKPASILILGPSTAEKTALIREITRMVSQDTRCALVDTRSAVGGYTDLPLECGQAIRYFVNDIKNQCDTIDSTRTMYPQVIHF